ncbi:UvrD-helicase domain-containing protein [Nitrosospira multiformis]|uniref:DNA helicase-2 / ATP-dependent DNA helicase PcrA n=1 Tax=Nitrosospira multiformis TaxID=1231 RepID=A0A1I7I546_9PROT|nr:UvrD-helicase domain-containing protein [Nitrosospira multiformis]SFU68047.1 DNA helicase-2 / ATP-dependent DNA helicase PcrA [Nitrosospira multiformis]
MMMRLHQPDTQADVDVRSCLDSSKKKSFIMVAGAGSGKTTSLVKALVHLSATRGSDFRRNSHKVACVTYTEIAVREIWSDVGNSPFFHVSTIHSFLWDLIQPFTEEIRKWVSEALDSKIVEAIEHMDRPRTQQRTKERLAQDIKRCNDQKLAIGRIKRFIYGTGSDFSKGVLGHDDILKIGVHFINTYPLMRSLLARQYPIVFIDESQDTFPDVVAALKEMATEKAGTFCLGFFGDPMQKIYLSGAGKIDREAGWAEITKPENFRCPQAVLRVINNIRAEDDGLEQTRGRHQKVGDQEESVEGFAHIFVLPADNRRTLWLEQVRAWMATHCGDDLWTSEDRDADVRFLVLVHRMAAERLGFPTLYSALNDHGSHALKDGLQDGTAWILRPLVSFVLPLVETHRTDQSFEVMNILRDKCPKLDPQLLASSDTVAVLKEVKASVDKLLSLVSSGGTATIRDVLIHLRDDGLYMLDDRIVGYLNQPQPTVGDNETGEEVSAWAFLATPAKELCGYWRYICDESPFMTQQGVKGAEYDRVLVVLDDEEASYSLFSAGKYFGYTALSPKDKENLAAGKDSVIERTRRLFYVSCSRTKNSLAVIVFAPEVGSALEAIQNKKIFEADCIHTEVDLPTLN